MRNAALMTYPDGKEARGILPRKEIRSHFIPKDARMSARTFGSIRTHLGFTMFFFITFSFNSADCDSNPD